LIIEDNKFSREIFEPARGVGVGVQKPEHEQDGPGGEQLRPVGRGGV
jgi:hypothetical protein